MPPKTIPIPMAIKGTIFLGTPACLTNCVNAIVITEITVANAKYFHLIHSLFKIKSRHIVST